ncbi:MAG: ATP-binding protein, partial [Promethearchaeota archaeon]
MNEFLIYFVLSAALFLVSSISLIIHRISAKKGIMRSDNSAKIDIFLVLLWIILAILIFKKLIEGGNLKYYNINEIILLAGSIFFIMQYPAVMIEKHRIKNLKALILEYPSFFTARRGTIELGKIIYKNRKKYGFYLSLDDLARHMFVTGITGAGKTNFVQYFLQNLKKKYDIPFLLVEFKNEYIYLKNIIRDLLVIRPGENFSINIFDPDGSAPEIHAERIFEALKSGGFFDDIDYSPQMERVLVDVLTRLGRVRELRSWDGFYRACRDYLERNKKSMGYLEHSILAIQNRLRRYSLGSLRNIFMGEAPLSVKSLFNKDVLLDLSSIIRLGGDKNDALFFLNLILKYLWDKNIEMGSKNYEGIRHITIVEDAQYFASKDLTEKTKLSSYLE